MDMEKPRYDSTSDCKSVRRLHRQGRQLHNAFHGPVSCPCLVSLPKLPLSSSQRLLGLTIQLSSLAVFLAQLLLQLPHIPAGT